MKYFNFPCIIQLDHPLHCESPSLRPTHPDVRLTLLGQTDDPIDLEDALITFDRKVGFTIEEGKLIHHNGIVTCR